MEGEIIDDIAPKLFIASVLKAELINISDQIVYFKAHDILFRRVHIKGTIKSHTEEGCTISDDTGEIFVEYPPDHKTNPGITSSKSTPLTTPVLVIGAIQPGNPSHILAEKLVILPGHWEHWPYQVEELMQRIYPTVAEQQQAQIAFAIASSQE